MLRAALLGLALFLAGHALPAQASVKVVGDATGARLCVNADGSAQVSWEHSRETPARVAVIDAVGRVTYGHPTCTTSAARPAPDVRIAMALVVVRDPAGRLHALQEWKRLPEGPVELRYARWTGAPTLLTLREVGPRVIGELSFHGRPVHGFRSTSQGVPLDPFGRNVYLDSFRGGAWTRMMGILTHRPTGAFRLWIRPHWEGTRYRGRVIGPNLGGTLAPDAEAHTAP